MTYIVGAFVEWYVLSWVCGCLPVIFMLLTIMMPESPTWLLANGREEEARQALQCLRGKYGKNRSTNDLFDLKILLIIQIKSIPSLQWFVATQRYGYRNRSGENEGAQRTNGGSHEKKNDSHRFHSRTRHPAIDYFTGCNDVPANYRHQRNRLLHSHYFSNGW